MSQVMRYEFHLFGPRKGQTININGHPFVKGICHMVLSSEAVGACTRVLSFYGAYARGTADYDAAMARETKANGTGEVHQEAEQGPTVPVRSNVRPDGAGPATSEADGGSGHADPDAGGSGLGAAGDGHGHAGVPKFEEAANYPQPTEPATVVDDAVKAAVHKLNAEVTDHWVMTGAHKGKPKLSAVEEALGKAGLTRDDIESAAPGWTRERALELALAG